jgi:glycolate oxidase iron-sulfur subunit
VQTKLSAEFVNTAAGREGEAILRKCVHCGFCNATCPTFQLLGDELDGPRGRIYLIKQVLEGADVTRSTQLHLDRCLTCRNCETTCPSGVDYGHLVDIGRQIVDARVARPATEKATRWLLKEGVTSSLFAPLLRFGMRLRPWLPAALRRKLPDDAGASVRAVRARAARWPTRVHARKVFLLAGCVQPAMLPNINSATARVLDAAGIQCVLARGAGCCGAIRHHLSDAEGALADMRRNIDAWWPALESGEVEAIISNASGCGVMIKDYGHALRHDPAYADKAARVAAAARDVAQLLEELVPALRSRLRSADLRAAAFHAPCTLQHGLGLGGLVETHLGALGFRIAPPAAEAHLCCGSAGTYSLLQPEIALQLRDRKLAQLTALGAPCILSANVGCIQHLQSGTSTPVRHWIEILDEALVKDAPT